MDGSASGYGYEWGDWLAKEDPDYAAVREPFASYAVGEGRELSIKYREMVMIGILAYRGRQVAVAEHMRRAIAHGATKRELLESLYAAQVPGGGPTLAVGVQALMMLEEEGVL